MLKFLGIMAVCFVLAIFLGLGPIPFVLVGAYYLFRWIIRRK